METNEIIQAWRHLGRYPGSPCERLLLTVIQVSSHNGVARLTDDELCDRVNEVRLHLIENDHEARELILRDEAAERGLSLQPFVEELRHGLLGVGAPSADEAAPALMRRAWGIVAREFASEFFWTKVLLAGDLMFESICGAAGGQDVAPLRNVVHDGFCGWLYTNKFELLSAEERDTMDNSRIRSAANRVAGLTFVPEKGEDLVEIKGPTERPDPNRFERRRNAALARRNANLGRRRS